MPKHKDIQPQEINNDTLYDIYNDRIDEIYSYFTEELRNPDDIYKPPVFTALLSRIYYTLFQPKPEDNVKYNLNTNIDTANIKLLDFLFNKYIYLCGLSNIDPTILGFCCMLGMDRDIVNKWIRGESRGASPSHCLTAKKWKLTCELSTVNSASRGNVGAIFLAKANYGMCETAPVLVPQQNTSQLLTAEEIENEYLLEDTENQ